MSTGRIAMREMLEKALEKAVPGGVKFIVLTEETVTWVDDSALGLGCVIRTWEVAEWADDAALYSERITADEVALARTRLSRDDHWYYGDLFGGYERILQDAGAWPDDAVEDARHCHAHVRERSAVVEWSAYSASPAYDVLFIDPVLSRQNMAIDLLDEVVAFATTFVGALRDGWGGFLRRVVRLLNREISPVRTIEVVRVGRSRKKVLHESTAWEPRSPQPTSRCGGWFFDGGHVWRSWTSWDCWPSSSSVLATCSS